MQRINIRAARPYEVCIGSGLLRQAGELVRAVHAPCAVALVTDETVAGYYGETVAQSLAQSGFRVAEYRFAPGERSKSMEQLSDLLNWLAERQMGRGDLIAALGGGVTGDLVGFAASIYQRGISYVQLPTTLLAAADSSVGGKTAVNLRAGKNLAGAFWQPELVICDCDTFGTLPRGELAAGAAECVKYAMLGSRALLKRMTCDGLDTPWEEILPACIGQKAEIVAQDERENGVRQLLNFGHTVGHAAELLSGYTIRHGEGVAIGMAILTRAAECLGICARGTADELNAALTALRLPTGCSYAPEMLAQAALGDKKRRGDEITLVLPRAVGECVLHTVKTAELLPIIQLGMEETICE